MQSFHDLLKWLDSIIGGHPWFVLLLLVSGFFFTVYLGFPQIRFFGHAIRCAAGKYDKQGDQGDTSHFQALTTALSGTIGTGNIAGVALAVHLGGPAALFWMLITAFLGMTTKFVEVTLSHKYREKAEDGSIAGGPMYYMKNRLNMKWLAVIFAVATVVSSFGTGNLPQINSIANSMYASFGLNHAITGAVLGILLFLVIIGGIKRIAKVTQRLVPIMGFIYVVGALAVIFSNIENIGPSFVSIFADIFSGTAATGGFLGASVAYAFNRGVNRGLFSNEAGQGSAPIAHAAARAHEPVSEGMVAILEPFIDTVVVCTLTGLVLLSSGVWQEKLPNSFQQADIQILQQKYEEKDPEHRQKLAKHLANQIQLPMFNGALHVQNGKIQENITILHARSIAEDVRVLQNQTDFHGRLSVKNGKITNSHINVEGKSLLHSAPLTTEAFNRSFLGNYGQYIVSIGLLLFAFSTAISWSYYGDRAMTFLLGSRSVKYYRIVYVGGFFIASFTDTTLIWTISGITVALMTIPNLIGILILHKEMKQTIADYWHGFHIEYSEQRNERK